MSEDESYDQIDIGTVDNVIKETEEMLDEIDKREMSSPFYANEMSEMEDRLRADTTLQGRFIFFLYKFWITIVHFEMPILFGICIGAFALGQMVFLQDTNNLEQSIVVGLLTSLLSGALVVTVYLILFYIAGRTDRYSNRRYFPALSVARAWFFLCIVTVLILCIVAIVGIHNNCFDENGNYIQQDVKELGENNVIVTTRFYCHLLNGTSGHAH